MTQTEADFFQILEIMYLGTESKIHRFTFIESPNRAV